MKYETYYVSGFFIADEFPVFAVRLDKTCPDTEEFKEIKRILSEKFGDKEMPMPKIYMTEYFQFRAGGDCLVNQWPIFITRIANNGETHVISNDEDIVKMIVDEKDCSGKITTIELPVIDLTNNMI